MVLYYGMMLWNCITGSYYGIALRSDILELYLGIFLMKMNHGMSAMSPEPPGIPGIPWARPWDPGGRPWDPRGGSWDPQGQLDEHTAPEAFDCCVGTCLLEPIA